MSYDPVSWGSFGPHSPSEAMEAANDEVTQVTQLENGTAGLTAKLAILLLSDLEGTAEGGGDELCGYTKSELQGKLS